MADEIPCEFAMPAVISGSIPLLITSAAVVCPMHTSRKVEVSIFSETS